MASRARTGSSVVVVLAVSVLLAGGVVWINGRSHYNTCAAACIETPAKEPMQAAADPADGLFRFGALQSVWDYSHRLADPDAWGEDPQGFLPADRLRPARRSRDRRAVHSSDVRAVLLHPVSRPRNGC